MVNKGGYSYKRKYSIKSKKKTRSFRKNINKIYNAKKTKRWWFSR